jgi:hypothetical protein
MLTDGIAALVARSVVPGACLTHVRLLRPARSGAHESGLLELPTVSVDCLPHLCKRLLDGHGERTQRNKGVRVGMVFA